jgi:hypothetical protein
LLVGMRHAPTALSWSPASAQRTASRPGFRLAHALVTSAGPPRSVSTEEKRTRRAPFCW